MLPILPLKTVCLPGEVLTVTLTEERYIQLVQRCIKHAGELAVVLCTDYENELETLKTVGCQVQITHHEMCSSGYLQIKVLGQKRFSFTQIEQKLGVFYAAQVDVLEDVKDIPGTHTLFLEVSETYQTYLQKLKNYDAALLPDEIVQGISYADIDHILSGVTLSLEKKQQGLATNSIKKRLELTLSCLHSELDMLDFVIERSVDEQKVQTPLSSLN